MATNLSIFAIESVIESFVEILISSIACFICFYYAYNSKMFFVKKRFYNNNLIEWLSNPRVKNTKIGNLKSQYSLWPKFSLSIDSSDNYNLQQNYKITTFAELKILLNRLRCENNRKNQEFLRLFSSIFEITCKIAVITFPDLVYERMKKKLGNNIPFKQQTNDQV